MNPRRELTVASVPRLAPKARLRTDRRTGRQMILYPEMGLALSATATAIVGLCSGERSLTAIVDALAEQYPGAPRERLTADAFALLRQLVDRGLMVLVDHVDGADDGPGSGAGTSDEQR